MSKESRTMTFDGQGLIPAVIQDWLDGTVLMVGFGVLTPKQAYAAVDYDTLVLLLGMVALLVARPFYPSESAATEGDGLPMVMLCVHKHSLGACVPVESLRDPARFMRQHVDLVLPTAGPAVATVKAVDEPRTRRANAAVWVVMPMRHTSSLSRRVVRASILASVAFTSSSCRYSNPCIAA